MSIVVTVEDVSFSYASKQILKNISFSVKKGEIVCLLGKNGSGKSTLLSLLAGIHKPSKGKIMYLHKEQHNARLVFQEPTLLEWKSVRNNIALALQAMPIKNFSTEKRINEVIRLLTLQKHANFYPSQLSGGLKQRTAIARALAPNPDLLLLDEPFSALDIGSKEQLMRDIRSILLTQGKSAVFITHSIDEAIYFADRVLLLSAKNGKIRQMQNNLPKVRTWDMVHDTSSHDLRKIMRNHLLEQ